MSDEDCLDEAMRFMDAADAAESYTDRQAHSLLAISFSLLVIARNSIPKPEVEAHRPMTNNERKLYEPKGL